jgi:hypothetical protein
MVFNILSELTLKIIALIILSIIPAPSLAQENPCGDDREFARVIEETESQVIYGCVCKPELVRKSPDGPCVVQTTRNIYFSWDFKLSPLSQIRLDTPDLNRCIAAIKLNRRAPPGHPMHRGKECENREDKLYADIQHYLGDANLRVNASLALVSYSNDIQQLRDPPAVRFYPVERDIRALNFSGILGPDGDLIGNYCGVTSVYAARLRDCIVGP